MCDSCSSLHVGFTLQVRQIYKVFSEGCLGKPVISSLSPLIQHLSWEIVAALKSDDNQLH